MILSALWLGTSGALEILRPFPGQTARSAATWRISFAHRLSSHGVHLGHRGHPPLLRVDVLVRSVLIISTPCRMLPVNRPMRRWHCSHLSVFHAARVRPAGELEGDPMRSVSLRFQSDHFGHLRSALRRRASWPRGPGLGAGRYSPAVIGRWPGTRQDSVSSILAPLNPFSEFAVYPRSLHCCRCHDPRGSIRSSSSRFLARQALLP